jgi:hypothetical protein
MHRRSGVVATLLALAAFPAVGQAPEKKTEGEQPQQSAPPQPPAPKPRPPVVLKPSGGTGSNVGDDAPGGGATTAGPSRGGTPGTPSGSFSGAPPKP